MKADSFPKTGFTLFFCALLLLWTAAGTSCGEEKFGGLGMNVAQLYDPKAQNNIGPLVVLDVFDGAPAARGGVRRGDVITRIDGDPTEGKDFTYLVENRIKGRAGTSLAIEIKRASTGETLSLTLSREAISRK
jgi:carboxyl-terminal processing protease